MPCGCPRASRSPPLYHPAFRRHAKRHEGPRNRRAGARRRAGQPPALGIAAMFLQSKGMTTENKPAEFASVSMRPTARVLATSIPAASPVMNRSACASLKGRNVAGRSVKPSSSNSAAVEKRPLAAASSAITRIRFIRCAATLSDQSCLRVLERGAGNRGMRRDMIRISRKRCLQCRSGIRPVRRNSEYGILKCSVCLRAVCAGDEVVCIAFHESAP
ncbi:hypothetical protein DdX_21523 [Ditylenchus destructor]|uniref:Uncharacterized protein n=1 Tax=Ditylenchus destructor TaxID=166010 RepID=A0AAD4QRC3_9BILA|nr:hypothetical protein DdX_21523 [Ditylenchus destructor]